MRGDRPVYDGTTGRGEHGGRRTHIIKLLRDAKEPLTVEQVAKRVNVPLNTARFHLESLVDAGLAARQVQVRTTPGRPKVMYIGVLPNQTHERAQGYRLLSEIMVSVVAQANGDASEWMYHVGLEWGRCLLSRGAPGEPGDEDEVMERLINKLDALWFAPECRKGPSPRLVMHNCPFADTTSHFPQVICQLHAGLINGSLEEMKSTYRLTRLSPQLPGHKCEGELTKTTGRTTKVPLNVTPRPKP